MAAHAVGDPVCCIDFGCRTESKLPELGQLDEDQNPDAYRELSITRRNLTPNQWVQRLVVIVVLALITTAFAVLIFDLHSHPDRK